MNKWEEKRFSDIATIVMGQSPASSSYNEIGEGIPFLQGNRTFRIRYPEIDMYTTEPKKIAHKNSILMSVRAPVGDINFAPEDLCIGRGLCAIESKVGSNDFLVYLLKYNIPRLKSAENGTTFSAVNGDDIRNLKIRVPSYEEQECIANILSTYDYMIETNNQRIELLEQAAQELYKEWFVRFRFPGYETVKFENGLPEGWKVKRMNEFCYVTDGTHDTPKPVNVGVPLITGRCISNGFVDFSVAYNISEADHEKIKKRSGLKSGDIIFSNIGTVGNCCVVDYDREFSVKNVIIFKPETMRDTAYLYYWMTSSTMQEIFAAQTNGASQQFVGLTFVRRYKLLLPNEDILEAFANNVLPIIEQKRLLHQNNLNLSAQRDLLLPRLMSGKLEV